MRLLANTLHRLAFRFHGATRQAAINVRMQEKACAMFREPLPGWRCRFAVWRSGFAAGWRAAGQRAGSSRG
jgi:hypothetical protein